MYAIAIDTIAIKRRFKIINKAIIAVSVFNTCLISIVGTKVWFINIINNSRTTGIFDSSYIEVPYCFWHLESIGRISRTTNKNTVAI